MPECREIFNFERFFKHIKMSFITEKIAFEGLTFDDVLLVPAYSEVLPSQVSTAARFTRNIDLSIPLASAAMDTVTEAPMAIAIAREGGIGVIHKNMTIQAQAAEVATVKAEGLKVAAGVGVTADYLDRVEALVKAGVDAVVVDSAHGHTRNIANTVRGIKAAHPGLEVVAGNIATAEAARFLAEAGADAVKVGIGPGSICTTRIVAGVGVPQLTAVYECSRAVDIPVIADGGLRYSGDIVKALAAGASCVMCGSMLAGTDEAPGELVDGYKTYRGMGSLDAMEAGSKDRYFQSGAKKLVPEGVVGRVKAKGPVGDVIFQILGGLKSGMGYCGAPDIEHLHNAKFVRITACGMAESHPHDITIAKQAPNYNV